jgi:hypothetical protein
MVTFKPYNRRVDNEAPTIAPPSRMALAERRREEPRKPMSAGGFEVLRPFPRRFGSRATELRSAL